MFICLMGVTCSGKSTFIQSKAKDKRFGSIEIGKEMRKRHTPDYFNSLGAMPHTEKEVWEIFEQQYAAVANAQVILIDGQPRLPSQVSRLMDHAKWVGRELHYVFFSVDKDETFRRLMGRFPNDAQSQALSLARSINDKVQLYDVVVELVRLGQSTFYTYPQLPGGIDV
jgi:adenylate kinase family enzyme